MIYKKFWKFFPEIFEQKCHFYFQLLTYFDFHGSPICTIRGQTLYDEHPLAICISWLVAGAAFSVYLFVKLGAFNPETKQIIWSEYNVPPVLSEELHPSDTE